MGRTRLSMVDEYGVQIDRVSKGQTNNQAYDKGANRLPRMRLEKSVAALDQMSPHF